MLLNVAPSPDGRRVAFEVYGGNLFVMSLDGSSLVDLGHGARPTWSPDGRWVAFMVTEDDGHTVTAADLVAARADGSGQVALTSTPDRLEMNPSWAPDGRALAFDDATDGALYLLPVSEVSR
jgi:Tol biopolymer transport system component